MKEIGIGYVLVFNLNKLLLIVGTFIIKNNLNVIGFDLTSP